jgi:hypothetical protein
MLWSPSLCSSLIPFVMPYLLGPNILSFQRFQLCILIHETNACMYLLQPVLLGNTEFQLGSNGIGTYKCNTQPAQTWTSAVAIVDFVANKY